MNELIMKRIGPPPPDNTRLHTTLEKIEGLDDEPVETRYGPCLRFVFRPTDERYAGRTITALASLHLNEYARLGQLLTAMIGREIADGEDIVPVMRALVGRPFELVARHDTAGGMTHLRAADITPAAE